MARATQARPQAAGQAPSVGPREDLLASGGPVPRTDLDLLAVER